MVIIRVSSCFFLLFQLFTALSQPSNCHLGDIFILKQSEIDKFSEAHPGCTSIGGDLVIAEEYEGGISNLEGLSQLKKIGGLLRIYDNKELASLKGLDQMDSIIGGISISYNPGLTDINSLSQLKEFGSIYISNNEMLQQIDTFIMADTLSSIIVTHNPMLQNLKAFGNLQHVLYGCSFSNNQSLTSMEGLSNLRNAIGYLKIENDSNLLSLQGFHNLAQLGGLNLNNNPKLTNLSGLETVNSITSLNVNDNSQLNSISELNNIIPDSLEQIQITNNPQLSQCQIEPICQRFLLVQEYPVIEGNGDGCNTSFELIKSCGLNTTCPGKVVLHTQSDVDHFAEVYPGCDSIHGDLIIEYSTISNLAGLAQVKHIDGDLILAYNLELQSLDGLEQVTEIEGNISLEGNKNLVSIAGLTGIHSINNGFGLYYNDKLKSLSGFMPFDSVTGNVYIGYSDSLADINIFSHVQHITGNVAFDNLPSLTGIQALENVERIGGSFELSKLNIKDLSPLSKLDTVNGGLTIDRCQSLKQLGGLTGLRFIMNLTITGNDSLNNLGDLSQIQHIPGTIKIADNPALTSISGFTALQQVGGGITISGNPELHDLNNLQQLSIANGITLKNNPRLADLSGLQQLQINHGNLIINSMPGLKNLHGLEQLQQIDGYLEISANDSILSLQGLTQLTRIRGNFIIKENEKLVSLMGIELLDSIGGNFTIDNCGLITIQVDGIEVIDGELSIINNTKLSFILGFNQLKSLNNILIYNNVKLTDLTGFNNLEFLTGSMAINKNSTLISLPSFNQLKEIGSLLELSSNINLVNLDFINHIEHAGGIDINHCRADSLYFTRLKRVEGNFEIDNIFDLKGIYADSLTRIDGKVRIAYNGSLTHLGSFQALLETGDDIEISYNYKLADIEALSSLHRFKGRLRIDHNENLLTLEGLRHIERSSFYVPENLLYQQLFTIQHNPALTTCSIPPICEILAEPGTEYYLGSNDKGCNNQIEIQAHCGEANSCLPDSVIFDSQASIDAFPSTYPGCSFVLGSLIIEESLPGDVLHLDSLHQIRRIGGDLVIRNNLQLQHLNGLDQLTGMGGSLEIQNNTTLNSLMPLKQVLPHEDLTEASSDQAFEITNNPNLQLCSIPLVCSTLTDPYRLYSLSDNMPGCNTVAEVQETCDYPTECECGTLSSQIDLEYFRIRHPRCTHITNYLSLHSYSESITNLAPLSLIESVDGPLAISSLNQLAMLTGLEQLSRLNGPLKISSNIKLEDISALSQLDASSIRKSFYHLELYGNTNLSECAIESICQLVENPEIKTKIENNGNTCKSREEILMECQVGILPLNRDVDILIYPNPAQDEIHLESEADLEKEIISIAIADMNGMVQYTSQYTTTLDISQLPAGLYALILFSRQHGMLTHRFIVSR